MVAGTSVMTGTFQVLSGPKSCMGSRALCFLPGLEKEGPCQVTLLSLSPLSHQTFLLASSPGSAGSQAGEFTEPWTVAQEMGRRWELRPLGWSQGPG